MNDIFNHLWQSTVFGAAIAVACVALRRNSPRLRYWLWLAASLKFLIPLSLLVSMGARIQVPPDTPSLHAVTVEAISTYFAPVSVFPAAAPVRATLPWPLLLGATWLAGAMFLLLRRMRQWRMIHLAARGAKPLPLESGLATFSSPAMMEPGVFGIFRPVILFPDGIADNLTPEQLAAILAHELRHVRCRDNLTAALHMCVETLFWFHPGVWWIGARLMDERERDCDETVLKLGSRPGDYARSIVHVCGTYIELPLASASGISGSDLKSRIREIMTWRGSAPMTSWGKLVFAAAAVAAVSAPFFIGVIRAQTLPPPPSYGYEVVSIHASAPGQTNTRIAPGPQGGLKTTNTTVMDLLVFAYAVRDYQFINAPAWVSSERYDITLTPDAPEAPLGPNPATALWEAARARNEQRLRAVLLDRFGLVLRQETRELPIYALVRAKGGAKLTADGEGGPTPGLHSTGQGQITGSAATIEMLTDHFLSFYLGRPVTNETGLTESYDFKLQWNPELDQPAAPPQAGLNNPSTGPSIFTALTEQLGLRLESKRGPVHACVVEKIERPTEN